MHLTIQAFSKLKNILYILNINLCVQSMKLKWKLCSNNSCIWKWSFYWFVTWKSVFIEKGINLWWAKKLLQVRDKWENFWLVGGLPPIPDYEKICNIYIYVLYIFIYIHTFHTESWPLWDSNPQPHAYREHALTTEIYSQTMKCASIWSWTFQDVSDKTKLEALFHVPYLS